MSLYNALFGENPVARVLKLIYKLDIEDGYEIGRYRDIYIKGDKCVLYTRNGGGNTETYQEQISKLREHEHYITDYEDELDRTFLYFEFKLTEELKGNELVYKNILAAQGDTSSVGEKFKRLVPHELLWYIFFGMAVDFDV